MPIRLFISFFAIQFSVLLSSSTLKDSSEIDDKWLAFDKVQHFTFSFLWTLSSQYILVNNMGMVEEDALPISMVSSLGAGLMKEISDMKKQKGYFSKKDLVANTFGIILAVVVINDNFSNKPFVGAKPALH
ncbi:MAG: hypothetical protein QF453_04715 [Candidatus Marinimicrobia bacterium]|jgi:uncharacterized protein YfiM (DUF2279 family)|nr:hypothetical protein [Candidatus Neomarinimicrobiota bacterium]